MIQIYYGLGKGKTSALNGAAIRAKGAGFSVSVFRFLKGVKSSEDEQLNKLDIPVTSLHPNNKFVIEMNEKEKEETKNAVLETLDLIRKCKSDIVILDEFIDLSFDNVNLMSEKEINNFISELKNDEIIISGHKKIDSLFDKADLISYVNAEKHYYDKGVKARKGFEY